MAESSFQTGDPPDLGASARPRDPAGELGRGQRPWRLRVAGKFFFVLGIIVPALIAMGAVAIGSIRTLKGPVEAIYRQSLLASSVSADLESSIRRAAGLAYQLVPTSDPATTRRLGRELNRSVTEVDARFAELDRESGSEPGIQGRLETAVAQWRRFVTLLNTRELTTVIGQASEEGSREPARDEELAEDEELEAELTARISSLTEPATAVIGEIREIELQRARASRDAALASFAASRALMLEIIFIGLALSLLVLLWLIRDIVPRLRSYSFFAADVARGKPSSRLQVRGADELTDLGWALNSMVSHREQQRGQERAQAEFVDAMQMTESEEEAHNLLKRHLERAVVDARAVVLNRNNSADRLEATTADGLDPKFFDRLVDARPRSCLSVRFARCHRERPDGSALVT